MSTDTRNPHDDSIPLLENPLSLDDLQGGGQPPLPDLGDHAVVARLLQDGEVQRLLDDMSEDLQKLVSWKMEELLKEHLMQLIRQAAEESAPRLAEDIRTQLQLALPGLLANLVDLARQPDRNE